MNRAGASLALAGVSKQFAGVAALDNISVAFPENVITAIVGPSGCGKSTLLKLCNGLARPDSGSVQLFGEPLDYERLPEIRRRLGYAVQGNGLFPHLTARDNISIMARLAGWSAQAIEQRLDELLDMSRLGRRELDKYPHELSGGQQQRAGLCRAVLLRPSVVLLDEPFASIDPITRLDIYEQLLAQQEAEPTTTVLVTHDMREAVLLAEHLIVMQAGNILYNAAKDDLLESEGAVEPETLLHNLLRQASS